MRLSQNSARKICKIMTAVPSKRGGFRHLNLSCFETMPFSVLPVCFTFVPVGPQYKPRNPRRCPAHLFADVLDDGVLSCLLRQVKKNLQACDLISITACKMMRLPDIEPDYAGVKRIVSYSLRQTENRRGSCQEDHPEGPELFNCDSVWYH